jgi:hypothetical protein
MFFIFTGRHLCSHDDVELLEAFWPVVRSCQLSPPELTPTQPRKGTTHPGDRPSFLPLADDARRPERSALWAGVVDDKLRGTDASERMRFQTHPLQFETGTRERGFNHF